MIRLLNTILFGWFLLLVVSCDAPRINPLDPQNPDSKAGQIDGFIYSYPRDPINAVHVTWQNISVETDIRGYYKISDVKMTDGFVYFEKKGFAKDSIFVSWNNQKSLRLEEKILNYTSGQIDGTILAAAPSLKPLAGANVYWKNKNLLITTNAEGKFLIDDVDFENGWLRWEMNGYSGDSIYIDFGSQVEKVKHLNTLYLNSIPKINDFKIFTTVENRLPVTKTVRMEVQVSITDDEGDIDSVFLKCDELGFNGEIRYNLSSRYFEGSYTHLDFNLSSMEGAIGKNFYVTVKDRAGKKFTIGSSNIKRIINDVIEIESPANQDVTSSTPALRWVRFRPGFNFYYSVQVYSPPPFPVLIWSRTNISKEDVQTIVNTPLASGDYYWVVWCVDDFGNKAQSFPASFSVK